MVRRLRQLVQDANVASRHGCCREDCRAKVFLADGLRTREGEQDAARLDLLECLDVQLAIALQSVAQGVAVLGEGRRGQGGPGVLGAPAVGGI